MKYLIAALITTLIALTWVVTEKIAQAAQMATMVARTAAMAAEVAALTAAMTRLTAEIARERVAARSKLARTKLKQKAVGRMQRVAALAPFAGFAAALYFEERDFDEWRQDHPDIQGDKLALRTAYWKDVYELTVEVLDTEYASLNEKFPGLREKLLNAIPTGKPDGK